MTELMISPSGIRGIVGQSLTPELAMRVGASYGSLIGAGPVVLGGDSRPSFTAVSSAVMAGLLSVGTSVITIGVVPTPTVQQAIRKHQAAGGLVITASHNPAVWNGIKLMNDTGSFLSDSQYQSFLSLYEGQAFSYKPWNEQGVVTHDSNALEDHIDLILERIDTTAIKEATLHVLVDPNNGAGAVADQILLDKLGVRYTLINQAPNGMFAHDPEPVERNVGQIKEALAAGNYDIGFVQDADADRLVILDENGRFIGEDYSLALCMDYVLQYDTVSEPGSQQAVVVNLSTSKVISDLAAQHQATVYQTKIGEPHVTAQLKAQQAVVGGEGNGGVIYPKIGWGRDSLVGIVLALCYLARSKKRVSEIVSTYPQYVMQREKVAVEKRADVPVFLEKVAQLFAAETISRDDGVKVMLATGWVHVRPSNTEPIVRVFVEEQSAAAAQALVEKVLLLNTQG